MAFGEGCDTVLINLDDGDQVIADKLGRLQSLAGGPLRVGHTLETHVWHTRNPVCSARI